MVLEFTYNIDTEAILKDVKREISKIASISYAEPDKSLYDLYLIKTSDEPIVKAMIVEAAAMIAAAFPSLCAYTDSALEFRIPDSTSVQQTLIERSTTDYIVFNVCSTYVQRKGTNVEQNGTGVGADVAPRSEQAFAKLSKLMYYRVVPKIDRDS